MNTMRKNLYLLLISTCVNSYAQDIWFTYSSGNSVSCEIITKDDTIISKNDTIDYWRQISKVYVKEDPRIPDDASKPKHEILVNGISVAQIEARILNWKDLENAITLQPGEIITCKRDGKEVANIVVKKKEPIIEKLLENIKFEINDPTENPFTFKEDKEQLFQFRISGLDKVDITKCVVKFGDDLLIPYTIKGDELSFTIKPDTLDANKEYAAKIELYVNNNGTIIHKEYPLMSVISPSDQGPSMIEIIGICLLTLLLLIIFVYIIIRVVNYFYFKKAKTLPVKTPNGERKYLKVHFKDSLNIGDVSNKSGEYFTDSNEVYRFKNRKYGYPRLAFIGYVINCKGGKRFILDANNNVDNNPSFDVNLSDSHIKFFKGASVEGEGEYELEEGFCCLIKNGKITEISKLLEDIYSKKTYRVFLTNNTVQKNDKVEPATNKTNYVIETADGFIYEISNNIIANIRNRQLQSNSIDILCLNNRKVTVITNDKEPKVGDIAAPDGEYQSMEGKVFVVNGGKITSLSLKEDITEEDVEKIRKELSSAKEQIAELLKRPTQEDYNTIKHQLSEANERLKNVNKAIDDAVIIARADEKRKVEVLYKKKISEEYISVSLYKSEKNTLERLKDDAIKAKKKAEDKAKIREGEIIAANGKIETLEAEKQSLSEMVIRLKASISKIKDAAQKKNVHYLVQIQEALTDISESFRVVYKDIEDSKIREGLIAPVVKGVSGLSAGILSWSEDFSVKVLGDYEAFFGSDYLALSEIDVKEHLAKKFISNIVKSDSFSKFVRLYQLSVVPFVRKQLIDAKMDINTLNKLYYKIYTLITDFGYTIICPRLFEEQHSDDKYQWFNSTNLFSIINLPDYEKKRIKEMGSETIIDVNQIGYESPWASRKATVVTPDF